MTTEQPVSVLDDTARMQSVDRRNMLRLINELPEQCETALGIGRSLAIDVLATPPNVVYLTGTGDSRIAADMAAASVADQMDVPVVSDHGGQIPAYVNQDSVVFIVDYSGKSDSALQNYKEAKQREALVICITSGGKLNEMAAKDNTRVVKIPPGQPARTAIGYLFVPLVAVMEHLGLVSGATEKLSFAIKLMKNVRETLRFENPTARNLAKQTALSLQGKAPIIYGASGYREVIVERWKSQCNANGKVPACGGVFPSVAMAEISGWEMSGGNVVNPGFVFLTDPGDKGTDIAGTMQAAEALLAGFGVNEVEMKGSSKAEKLLYGAYFGDYLSYYLALLYETNPSITENVAFIESKLAEE